MPTERSYTDVHEDAVAQPRRRRRLNSIRITKIDAVNRPAQEYARVTLLKGHGDGEPSADAIQAAILEGVREAVEAARN